MKFKPLPKVLATTMAAALISTTCMVAFAADVTGTQDNNAAGTGSTIPVVVTADAPIFKAVVPLSLPISVDASGNVTAATNAKIANQSSFGKIKVQNIAVNASTGWTLDNFTDKATFGAKKVNKKDFAFKINTIPAAAGTIAVDETNFPAIAIGEATSQHITYDALIPPQSNGLSNIEVGSVVFTIGWDAV